MFFSFLRNRIELFYIFMFPSLSSYQSIVLGIIDKKINCREKQLNYVRGKLLQKSV